MVDHLSTGARQLIQHIAWRAGKCGDTTLGGSAFGNAVMGFDHSQQKKYITYALWGLDGVQDLVEILPSDFPKHLVMEVIVGNVADIHHAKMAKLIEAFGFAPEAIDQWLGWLKTYEKHNRYMSIRTAAQLGRLNPDIPRKFTPFSKCSPLCIFTEFMNYESEETIAFYADVLHYYEMCGVHVPIQPIVDMMVGRMDEFPGEHDSTQISIQIDMIQAFEVRCQ